MSSLIEAPEAMQEEQDALADVSSITSTTLPSAPWRGLSSLLASLRALTALAARQPRGRSRRVMLSNNPSMDTSQDVLTRQYPDLYIRCMTV
jgi:hypothetical protein